MVKVKRKCGRCGTKKACVLVKRNQMKWVTTFCDGVIPAWFNVYECDNCGKYGASRDVDAPLGVPMRAVRK